MTMTRLLLVLALLFPVVANAQSVGEITFAIGSGESPHFPIAITTVDGDTYTFHKVVDSDGKPILLAQADTGSAALPDAGPASAPTPTDRLADPTKNPAQALSDIKQAERQGWPVLVFMIGAMLAKLLGRAKKIAWLAWLDKGRTAIVVGAVGALLTAGYNAMADGGSLYAALYAGAIAGAAYWNPLKQA